MVLNNIKYKYKIWFKAIAFTVALLFLWNNIVWANPAIFSRNKPTLNKDTLSQVPFFALEEKAETFRRVAVAHVNREIQYNSDIADIFTVRKLFVEIFRDAEL